MKKLIVLIVMLISISAYAFQSYLVSSHVELPYQYCNYFDGRVLVISPSDLCPLFID